MDKNKIASYLLDIEAVQLNTKKLFTWASGIKSPIYCDNRKILSFPAVRRAVRDEFAEYVESYYPNVEIIAGVATGGIAIGVLVAEIMDLPFVYVRPKAKEHGLQNQIEGVLKKEQKVVVIEDLISTGGSSLKAVDALRKHKANVLGLIAIFTYNIPISVENFKNQDCEFHTLTDFNTLNDLAVEKNYIKNEDIEILNKWRKEFK